MSYFRPNIESMAGYRSGEQPRDAGVVKLNTNENPYGPSLLVIEAVRQAADDGLRKYPDPLATKFREQAAALFSLEPDWILAGNGSDDILTIITRSFVSPGALVVAPTPSYILYQTLAQIQDARYQEVPFTASWDLPDDFGARGASLVFLPNPNSPSGTQISPDRVAQLARRSDGVFVIDEAYVEFAETDCVALMRELENVIITRSLSKSYSLAGVRFGYAVARPETTAGLAKVKDSYNCDALSIVAATAALKDQEYFQTNVTRVRATRSRLIQAMRDLGFRVPDSSANFVWCTDGPRGPKELYEELKRRGILVRYMNYRSSGDGLRITVGRDAEIDQLIDVLRCLV